MFLISLVKIIFFADQMHSCWCPSSSIKLAHTLVLSDSYYPADQLDRKFWLLRNHGFLVDITNILEKLSILFFLRFDLFLERGKGEERERNINVWLPLAHPQLGTPPATQACALIGNRTCGFQTITQSTEQYQSGKLPKSSQTSSNWSQWAPGLELAA